MIGDLRKRNYGHPVKFEDNPEEWTSILLKMEEGFKLFADEDLEIENYEESQKKIREALRLYSKYIGHLWD
jgi:hypothetical protein